MQNYDIPELKNERCFKPIASEDKVGHDGGAKIDVGPKKLNGELNGIPDKISWSTEGTHLPLENILVLPTGKLSDEALRAFEQAQELSSDMTPAIESIRTGYKQLQDSMAATSEVFKVAWANLPDYASVFHNVYPALQRFADYAKEITRGIDFDAIAGALSPLALKAKRVELLGRANWPMYLVDDAEVCDGLDMLPPQATDGERKSSSLGLPAPIWARNGSGRHVLGGKIMPSSHLAREAY